MITHKAFAEIIESSLHGWLVQSWQWDQFPSFGSLVSVAQSNRTLIGLVHQVKTGSIDPTRSPFAYQKTEQELLQEQPQIFEFLKTTFSVIFIGYQEQNILYYTLAPEPVKIHSFVQQAPLALSAPFLESADYLHVLFGFSHQIDNLDELLLALLKYALSRSLLSPERLTQFMSTYSLLIGSDYRRIKLFLQRAQHIITPHPISRT